MELKQLTYFAHIAELGSFSRAEELLSISQPHLSRQIRLLEEEVGQKLFARNGRGVVLTDAGRIMLVHAQLIVGELDRARRNLAPEAGEMTGDFVIGMPPSVARLVAAPIALEFRARIPGARLVTHEFFTPQILNWINEGRLDLALAHNAPPGPAYDRRDLFTEPLHLVSPAGDGARGLRPEAITTKEATRYAFVVHSGRQMRRMLTNSESANSSIEINVVAEAGSIDGILDLVRSGVGHAALHPSAVRHRRDEFVLRPIVDPQIHISLSLLTPKQVRNPGMAAAVAEMVFAAVGNAVAGG